MENIDAKTSTFSQTLLWFGAAVSIAELMAGALIAPLGLEAGLAAILLGHVIGAAVLIPAGLIGAKSGLSWAASTRISYSKYGSWAFSALNILQLLGWTAVMIIGGATAFDGIAVQLWGVQNTALWSVAIGALICVWVFLGLKNLSKVNTVIIALLFIFTLMLGFSVFSGGRPAGAAEGAISFGAAVELNVSMALSWLPLIADYTRTLKKPVAGTIGSVAGYFVGSLFMFGIGLGAAVYYGTSDVFVIMAQAGMGLAALATIVLSTVTTTFLDVYSAGVSAVNLNGKISEKWTAAAVCAAGVVIAIFVPIERYEDFLYLISSVFAPLFGVSFADYFLLGKREMRAQDRPCYKNLLLWLAGFIAYRLLLPYNTAVGITLPVMAGVAATGWLLGTMEKKPAA
ncbi:MAG TPA: putative hydroxymethylpyrimidine transporter CytX [Candidatus Acidoferrum sp.]|nr:putative hydroxymethylpyrimidine transporter CytX [Candidatus Acidoferrum sp.]